MGYANKFRSLDNRKVLTFILAVGFIFLLIAGRVISSKERTIERVTVPEVAERIADASQRDFSH